MDTTDGTSQDTGSYDRIDDAANAIEALLTSGDSEDRETHDEAEEPQPDEDEGDEPEASEDESDEQEEPEEQTEQPATFTVKVDGEEVTVTLDELQRGYSRTQDYTRKTMELAEARKALEPEVQALRQERDQYAQLLPKLSAFVQQQWESPELQALRETNPAEYLLRRDELRERAEAIEAEQARVTEEQRKEQDRARQELVRTETAKLIEADPAFKTPGFINEVANYAMSLGFSLDELSDTHQHQAWVVLHKAMQFDQLKAKAPQTKAKVEAVKTAKPGSAARQPPKVTDLTRAKQRLAKTGRVDDAAAAIERMLG